MTSEFLDRIQPAALPLTHWRFGEGDRDARECLSRELGLLPVMAEVLAGRNISTPDDAKRYLHPSLKDLHNPFLMQDMEKAVHRVIQAIHRGERIRIFGDYDADGITSVVVLMKFLNRITPRISYHIPHRVGEGYGLSTSAVDRMKAEDISLIITVDCGISDHDAIVHAKKLGIDTVILDHHEVPPTLPPAVAAVDPNRPDCAFPFKHLAGVGIAFNFLIALRGRMRQNGLWQEGTYPNLKDYLDLVALGTIGDICPLIDENRIFAKIGLELISENRRLGIKALKEISGLEGSAVDSNKASFSLIPRINAAGRIGSPEEAVRLLLTEDEDDARRIALQLDAYNRRRQAMEKDVLDEILESMQHPGGEHDPKHRRTLVFASPNWHPGIIGIVASRLVDRFCRPTILISLKDGIGKGSGRSIADFNIYEGLRKCDHLLLSYGGHQFAAGISIREENIARFAQHLEDIVESGLQLDDMVASTTVEATCSLSALHPELMSQLDLLAPFGRMNPEPILCARNVHISMPNVVGKNHLRMRVSGDGHALSAIWFGRGSIASALASRAASDIVFTPQINSWNGSSEIQMKVKDLLLRSTETGTPA